jgi:hypothetical protein
VHRRYPVKVTEHRILSFVIAPATTRAPLNRRLRPLALLTSYSDRTASAASPRPPVSIANCA